MVRNIIFDVGGVLLEYRWREMLTDYGLSYEEAERVGRMMFDDPLWNQLDLSDIAGGEGVIKEYMKKYPKDSQVLEWFLSHEEYMHVPRRDVWELVHKLKEKGYRLYLLSNYPERMFLKHTKDAGFMEDMDGGVVSYQVHMAKPDLGIYRHLLDKYQLVAEECLFFDDRPDNTEAAGKLGIQTVTVTSREFLVEKLKEQLYSSDK